MRGTGGGMHQSKYNQLGAGKWSESETKGGDWGVMAETLWKFGGRVANQVQRKPRFFLEAM